MCATLLVIDNYDSFTFNLVQMFRQYNLEISVYRSDKITIKTIQQNLPDYILISPGPKNPKAAGISVELIQSFYQKIPILGVCLGMQCINEAFGGVTIHAPHPMHAKTSLIHHNEKGIFAKIPSPFLVARYHSLVIDNVPEQLEITARSPEDNVVMGVSHRDFPLHGVQFHPESFLTEHGFYIISNFLKLGPLEKELS